jgi:hypothetical protein
MGQMKHVVEEDCRKAQKPRRYDTMICEPTDMTCSRRLWHD